MPASKNDLFLAYRALQVSDFTMIKLWENGGGDEFNDKNSNIDCKLIALYNKKMLYMILYMIHYMKNKHTIFEIRTNFEINKYKYQRG